MKEDKITCGSSPRLNIKEIETVGREKALSQRTGTTLVYRTATTAGKAATYQESRVES